MGDLPTQSTGGSSGYSLAEFYGDSSAGYSLYALGTFMPAGLVIEGTISEILFDTSDPFGFPNIDITGLSFSFGETYYYQVIEGSNWAKLLGDVLAGKDKITGSSGNDTIFGFAGNDTVGAGEGNDSLEGSTGNDSLLGSAGDDTVSGGTGADTLNGGTGNDMLSAGKGHDLMNGGADDDQLLGLLGNDTLTGGGGGDEFVFNTALNATTNVDRIEDFAGSDLIHLDNAVFTGIGAGLGPGEFRIGTSAADASDRIIYNSVTGALFFDADGAGGAGQVRFAMLDPGLALSNADFLMI
jgi:Ca2+-binding RTX toxin-like protein